MLRRPVMMSLPCNSMPGIWFPGQRPSSHDSPGVGEEDHATAEAAELMAAQALKRCAIFRGF